MRTLKCSALLFVAVLAVPFTVQAQRDTTRLGPCGATNLLTDEDQTFFVAPKFVDGDSAQVRFRSELGIVQQPAGTTAVTVTDERLCRRLSHLVREALRARTRLRLNDVVPTYLKVGRYYVVSLDLADPLPEGTSARLPIVIIDGDTMTWLHVILG